MSFVSEIGSCLGSLAVGIGAVKCLHWAGKKIAKKFGDPNESKVGRIVLGILYPVIVNEVVNIVSMDRSVKLFIGIGVVAQSVNSGLTLGLEFTRNKTPKELAKIISQIAVISVAALTKNVDYAATTGFLTALGTFELYPTRDLIVWDQNQENFDNIELAIE